MRRSIVVVLIAVVVVIVALAAAVSLLNVDKFRPRIQSELQAKLDRPVTLGQLHLRLFPLAIRVDGLTIGQSPGWPSQYPLATAKEVYASAGFFSLLRRQPKIKDLTLDQPQIELIRNAQGAWNFATIGAPSDNAPGNSPPAQAGNQQSGRQASELSLNRLKISDGQVAVTDLGTKSPRAIYNHIDLTVDGFAPGKQFDFDLAAHFPGRGKELLAFSGKAGPLGAGNTGALPLVGQLSIQEVSLAGLNTVSAGAIPPNTDGVLSANATLNSQGDDIAGKGNLKVENAVLRGAKVNYPIDAQYDLIMDRKQNRIQIHSGSVKLGPTAVSISGLIDSAVAPSTLNLRLNTANASITELSRLASAFGVAFDPNDQVKGSVTADLAITGSIKAPQVQGRLSANSIQAQNVVLNNVHATANMNNGVITLSPVTAGAFGGQANGAITADTRPAHTLCSVKANLSGADANALLSALTSLRDTLYGNLAGDTNVSFTVGSNVDIARTLNGVLNFNVANGQLKNINIINELSRVGKFLSGAPAAQGSGTALQKFSGTLNIKDGVATTNNLVATLQEGSLSAIGSLNLANQGLDLHMTAVLAKGISSAVGGTGIGGYLNTALANNQGELVLPVLVTGTTAHPVFAPDVQAIAKMKVNHLLPTTGDPSKLTNGIVGSVLGGVLGQSSGQSSDKQKNQPQPNPLDSLFKQLGKKKQPH